MKIFNLFNGVLFYEYLISLLLKNYFSIECILFFLFNDFIIFFNKLIVYDYVIND